MILQSFLILFLWVISTILDLCLIGIIDGEKLNFEYFIDKERIILILICIFAPIVFIILILGVAAKGGIYVSNNLFLSGKKNCSECIHCLQNECMFFKLTIKPKMLCKGRFFNSNLAATSLLNENL